jgi:DNA-binding NtrC family response regulator
VLVIDDDQDIREYLQDLLDLEGFEVTTLADPTVAIPRILGEVFQLIMLDLMMPKITGLDLLAQIRAVDDDIPVIIMTSYASFETAWVSIERGISAYITHPSELAELRTLITWAMKERKKRSLHAAIGRLLRNRCQVRGLTLEQVARGTNLSVSLLSQIERGEPSISVSSLSAVAAMLGVSMTELLAES